MNTDSNVKKSLAKRILKWSGISFLVLIIIVMITPFLFKDKLVQLVKEEANKSLNAKVDFGDFDLTLFSSFPDFINSFEDPFSSIFNSLKKRGVASFIPAL